MSRRTSRKSIAVVSPSMEEFVSSQDFDFGAAFQSPKGVVTRARRSSIGGNAIAPLAKPKTRRQSIMPTLEEVPIEKPTSRRRSVLPPPPPKTKIPVKKETTLSKPAPAPKKVATKVKKAPSPKKASNSAKELELRLEDESPPVSPIKLGILSSSFYGTPKKTTQKEPVKTEKKIPGNKENKEPSKIISKVEKKTPAKVENKAPEKTKKKASANTEKKTQVKVEKKIQTKVQKKTPAKVEAKVGAKTKKEAPTKVGKKAQTKAEKEIKAEPQKETTAEDEKKAASVMDEKETTEMAEVMETTIEKEEQPMENMPPSPKIVPIIENEPTEEKPLIISPIKADRGIMASSFYNSPKKAVNPAKINDDSFIENIDDMFVKTPEDGEKPTKTFETEAPQKTKRRRTLIEIKSPIVKVGENERQAQKSDATKTKEDKPEIETSTPKKSPKSKAKKVESKKTKTPKLSKTPKKTPKGFSVKVNVRKMKARKTPKTPAISKTPKTTVLSTKKVKAKTPKVPATTEKSTPAVSTKVDNAETPKTSKSPKSTPVTTKSKTPKAAPQVTKTKTPKSTPNVTKTKTPKSTPLVKKSKTPKSTPKVAKSKTPKSTPKPTKLKTPKSSTPKAPTAGKKRKLAVQITPIAKRLKTDQNLKTPAAIDPGNLLKRKLKRTVETAIDEKLADQPKTTPHVMMEGVSESGSPRKILAPLHTSTVLNTEFVKQHLTGTPAIKKARKQGTALRPNPMFLEEPSALLTPQKTENINSTPMKENRFSGAPHPLDDVEATPILAPGKMEPISPEPQLVTGKLEKMCSIM